VCGYLRHDSLYSIEAVLEDEAAVQLARDDGQELGGARVHVRGVETQALMKPRATARLVPTRAGKLSVLASAIVPPTGGFTVAFLKVCTMLVLFPGLG